MLLTFYRSKMMMIERAECYRESASSAESLWNWNAHLSAATSMSCVLCVRTSSARQKWRRRKNNRTRKEKKIEGWRRAEHQLRQTKHLFAEHDILSPLSLEEEGRGIFLRSATLKVLRSIYRSYLDTTKRMGGGLSPVTRESYCYCSYPRIHFLLLARTYLWGAAKS